MTFTRNSAVFPVREISLLKEKLVHWTGNFSSGILLDSNSYKNDYSSFEFLAAAGEEIVMAVSQQGVFDSLRQFHDQHHDWLFGYLSYDLKNEVEPRALSINNGAIDEVGFPLAHFFSPSHIIEVSGDSMTIQTTDDPQKIFNSIDKIDIQRNTSLQGSRAVQHRFPRKNYIEAVEQLREHIASGDLYEINLCQEFYIRDFKEDPTSLYQRLNSIAPAPFSCFLKHHQRYLLCSSPERFLRKQGTKMISQPMKGTIRRKDHASVEAEDQLLIERLRNDPKERAENVMIVDLVRNDLARSAVPGSVSVEELFGIYSFPNVHQMVSTVSASLRNDVHFVDALKNAFPMGSMTGAPKVMAMQLIDQYERNKRGLFSGAVGYITPGGDFDFNVVIRSLLFNAPENYLSFQTGSAITFDSVAENEYEECMLKAKGLFRALSY